jgi:hypothetical protein
VPDYDRESITRRRLRQIGAFFFEFSLAERRDDRVTRAFHEVVSDGLTRLVSNALD